VRALALTVALAGCAHDDLVLEPRELAHHVAELRRAGRATVELSPHGSTELRVDQALAVRLRDQAQRAITVAELIAHCPDVPRFAEDGYRRDPPCLLDDIQDAPVLGTSSHVDWDALGPALVIAGAVGLGACAFECKKPLDVIAGATLGVAGGVLLVIGISALGSVAAAVH
jgi:hypothetical protein